MISLENKQKKELDRFIEKNPNLYYNTILKERAEQEKLRTRRQNDSLHLWCEEVARELNNTGIDMSVLVKNLQVSHTKESVKAIWRAIANAKYGKTSTTQLTSKELNDVCEEMNKMLANVGVHLAFPSNEYFIHEN